MSDNQQITASKKSAQLEKLVERIFSAFTLDFDAFDKGDAALAP